MHTHTHTHTHNSRCWFFEKTNKIDKLLLTVIKKKREKSHIDKIRNEKGEVKVGNAEI